ncbi:UBX domain containing protein [Nitzschia inconspicua]|uniref:UBX domain containing protein n=1 Tax=Nitzschia inconspicua TaxID=303405 RepID=A0A9K3Q820_9STRA|nr:UBX domain containing protein [Nitzschia inconspicua]
MLLVSFLFVWMVSTSAGNSSSSTSLSFSQRFHFSLTHRKQNRLSFSFLKPGLITTTHPPQQQDNKASVDDDVLGTIVSTAATTTKISSSHNGITQSVVPSILKLRGGADNDEEDEESDDDDDDEETASSSSSSTNNQGMDYAAMVEQVVTVTKTKVVPVVVAASQKAYNILSKATLSTYHALQRAVRAAMEGVDEVQEENEDDEDLEVTMADQALKLATKIIKTVQRMVVAALDFPKTTEDAVDEDDDDDDDDDDESGEIDTLVVETKKKGKKIKVVEEETTEDAEEMQDEDESEKPSGTETEEAPTKLDDTRPETESLAKDFGVSLAEMYNVLDGRTAKATVTVMGGSFKDALAEAKQQARLLLVFIPAERPNGGRRFLFGGKKKEEDGPSKDKIAIENLLSPKVAKAANKKARKKGSDAGSFALWSAKAGSSEANFAIKQLKVDTTNKGENVPILAAVYPAYGKNSEKLPTIVPKLLSQHHCNPPPDAEGMTSWMNTIRKRNAQYYVALQRDAKEIAIYKERTEGYSESVKSDTERKKEEAKLKAEQKAKEEALAKRQKEIKERRKELKKALPEDVKNGAASKQISLRFADGRSGQRGFSSDQPLSVLFNWVDAMFEMERETVVLTTMNGKMTFSWDEETIHDTTLEDAGLGKMTAFRVTAKKEEDKESEPVAA